MRIPPVRPVTVARRLAAILGTLAVRGAVLPWYFLGGAVRKRTGTGARQRWLTETITELGPAFVKVAQLLSTRPDLVPPRICASLGELYDDVRPIPPDQLVPLLEPLLGSALAGIVARDGGAAAASGSIACVYTAQLPDGSRVAIKVRRPGIEQVLATDLTILRRGARALGRLPWLRAVPVTEIVDQLTESVFRQLDLAAECEHLDELYRNMARFPRVRVPRPYRELSGSDVVVMEFVEDLRRLRPSDIDREAGEQAVVEALRGVYQMLFQDGLVHCDLHPGNLYLRRDGSVAIVDAGFTVRLTPQAQDKFAGFFLHMAKGNGARCADIVLSTATPGPETDVEGFRRALSALVEAHSGVSAAEFDLVGFATRLFDIQRRFGLYADPQFVFPILSLLVLEGTIRDFAPDVDFQHEAMPFLVHGTMERAVRAWQASLSEADRLG
ncbi:ubiquinone biosynthesis protein [Prauserella shujinwangii]|uniref:Ubiquinone biosynthesis protein n=2 Tax=Prauserella shujinwangii TaxID=1453103 RepID=A0A2T0LNB5_9PSEU|nr:ubiquinone biosynthesis protein [Prauserella shujinwangii]